MKTSRSSRFSRFSTPLPFITFFFFYFLLVRKTIFPAESKKPAEPAEPVGCFSRKNFPAVSNGRHRRHPLACGIPPSAPGTANGRCAQWLGRLTNFEQKIECHFPVLAVRSFYSSSCVKSPRTAPLLLWLSALSSDFESLTWLLPPKDAHNFIQPRSYQIEFRFG